MAKAVVPVVIKLLAEADSSIEGAVASVRNNLQQAAQKASDGFGRIVETGGKKIADGLGKALSQVKISFASDKAFAESETGIKRVNQSSQDLDRSLNKIMDRFYSVAQAAKDVSTVKVFDTMIAKAGDLDSINDRLKKAYADQKKAAEELRASPPENRERNKDALDRAKLLTKELSKEATIIQGAYTRAFQDVQSSLTKLSREAERSISKTKQASSTTLGSGKAQQSAITNIEISLINQKAAADKTAEAHAEKLKKNAQERLELERRISDIADKITQSKIRSEARAVNQLGGQVIEKNSILSAAQSKLQSDTQKQLDAAKKGDIPEVNRLKKIAAESKVMVDQLQADAKKIDKAYADAFAKVSKEAEKALKQPSQGSSGGGGRLSSGLGIFSPIANQLGSAIDQIIGLTGVFRTTAGIQIGQSLVQGIGQGIADGASAKALNIDTIISEFSRLDSASKALVTNFSTAFVVGAAAAAAAMGGLALVTLKVASDFEVLTAKLTTTFKSPTIAVERFQQALELAAKTPYNVEQVVAAQVQLSALGQKNIGILQSTIDLASGLNADLARTANEVGKAAAGSLRGYQELRNTLGITQERLKQFGGVVDSQNRLLVQNEYQIKKNREALLSLIKADFGGSAERLSRTLQGRISNLQDEILKLGGSIGSFLVPQAKAGVEALSDYIKIANDAPPAFKAMAAGILTTGAAMGTFVVGLSAASLAIGILGTAIASTTTPAILSFAAVIPGATAALNLMDLAINANAASMLRSYLPTLGKMIISITNLTGVSAAFGSVFGTSLATAAAPLAALIAAAGLANTLINIQGEAAEKTGRYLKQYADDVANARRANTQLKEELVRVFELPTDFISDLDTTAEKIAKIEKEFDKRGALRLAQDLGLAGLTGEQLTEQFAAQSEYLRVQEEKLAAIKQLKEDLFNGKNFNDAGFQFNFDALQKAIDGGLITGYAEELRELVDLDPSQVTKKFDEFDKQLTKNVAGVAPLVTALRLLTGSLSEIESLFDKTQKSVTRAEGPAKFALKVGDINLINSALKEQEVLQQRVLSGIENTKGLREKEARGTKFSIEEATRLLAGATGPSKDYLQNFIKINETITELTNKRTKVLAEQEKYKLQSLEASEKRALSTLGKGSKDQQLLIIGDMIKLVKAKADLYQADLAEYTKTQNKLQSLALSRGERFRLQNELDRSTEKIDAGKKAFDLLIDLERKKAQITEQIEAESLKKSKQAIEDKYTATKRALDTFVDDVKQIASGVRPTEVTNTKSFIGIDGKTIISVQKPLEEFSDAALTASEKIEIFQNKLFELRNKQASTKFTLFGDKADELKKSYRDAERELEIALDRAKIQRGKENIRSERTDEAGQKRVVRENFADFKTGLNQELANTIGKEKQLEVIQKSKLTLLREESLGHISNRQFRAENAILTKKERDLQLDLNRAVADQTRELEKIRAERIADEIEILELKKQGATQAEKVSIDSQIKGRKKQKVQEQFNELQAELKFELEEANKNGKNRELILEKFAQKQESIVRKAYLDHQKAEQDKLKATTDRLKAEEDALKGFREKRLGGRNSPLISIEELSFQSTLPGFGSDADSRLSREQDRFRTPFGSQPGGAKIPSYESYKAKFEQENNLKLGKDGKPLPSSFDNLQPINTGGGTQITNYVNIDSRSVGDADIVKAGADLAMSAMAAATKSTSLISGNKGGAIQAKPFGAKPFGAKQIGSDAGFGFSL